jgi:hypothetical protein
LETHIRLEILPQPDETTCGPTCLHALYRYYGDDVALPDLIAQVPTLEDGGTLAVLLANHALRRGYRALIYTYNLQVFDPTWFEDGVDIRERLRAQMEAKDDPKLRMATEAYLDFLGAGGEIRLRDLTTALIRKYLKRGIPILTGLSATYLYRQMREDQWTMEDDDVRGQPSGHFVVLSGYDSETRMVLVADPYLANPLADGQTYETGIDRLINSILLGILTYDANLLIIERKPET